MELQPVILAGGRGSHMTELTNKIPKPLLPVGNQPMIFYSLKMLTKSGFQEVIIVTLKSIRSSIELIVKAFSISVKYISIEDDSDCDTLDSLRLIKDYIKCDMLIISCDFISDISLRKLVDVHKLHDSSVTMLLSASASQSDLAPGVKSKKKGQQQRDFIGLHPVNSSSHRIMFMFNEADLEDETLPLRMNVLREFPCVQVRSDLRDAHVYILKKWILDYITHNESMTSLRSELLPYLVHKQFSRSKSGVGKNGDKILEDGFDMNNRKDIFTFLNEDKERDVILDLSLAKKSHGGKQLQCNAHVYEEGFLINANNIAAYVDANRIVAKSDSKFCEDSSRISGLATIHEKSQVGNDCMVGERTNIEEKSSIKRSVIGRDCKIGAGVRISNCVIMDKVIVENGCTIQGSIVSEDARIGEKSEVKDCLIGFKKEVATSSKLSRESVVDSVVMMEFD